MKKIILVLVITLILSLTVSVVVFGAEKWASDVKIRFFVGGDPGDTFSTVVYNGALQAAADTGAQVEYVFSGWDPERMINQLREAIAEKPDGIAMMGHPGDVAIMPLAKEAYNAGVIMMYQNVDVPDVRALYGGGYVGANLVIQGSALADEAIKVYDLKPGDYTIVVGPFGEPGRGVREAATADRLEEKGMIVTRITSPPGGGWASNPSLAIPSLSAAFLAHPEVKAYCTPGGQFLGAADLYGEAIGSKPGKIGAFGYDLSAAVIRMFEEGWVQLTSDQQPFLQGYIPILSICLTAKYELASMNVDTSKGFVYVTNYQPVKDLAEEGYR